MSTTDVTAVSSELPSAQTEERRFNSRGPRNNINRSFRGGRARNNAYHRDNSYRMNYRTEKSGNKERGEQCNIRNNPTESTIISNTQSMEQRSRLFDEEGGEQCVICCNKTQYFAIGTCCHYVCFICGIRLRVLGNRKECSICREMIKTLIITNTTMPPSKSTYRHFLSDRRFGKDVLFVNDAALEICIPLMQNICKECPDGFECTTFDELDKHIRRTHQKFFCKLCLDYLQLFPYERKVYSKEKLAQHNRLGDEDDTSYEGHPMCEFCEQRFFDNDELYRHLRREHFYCHVCENLSGILQMSSRNDRQNLFYESVDELTEHFKSKHHYCPLCVEYPYATATAEDLRLHHNEMHGATNSRGERILKLNINFQRPEDTTRRSDRNAGRGRSGQHGQREPREAESTKKLREAEEAERELKLEEKNKQIDEFDITKNEFPDLPINNATATLVAEHQQAHYNAKLAKQYKKIRGGFDIEEFPTLSGDDPLKLQREKEEGRSQQIEHTQRNFHGMRIVDDEEDAKNNSASHQCNISSASTMPAITTVALPVVSKPMPAEPQWLGNSNASSIVSRHEEQFPSLTTNSQTPAPLWVNRVKQVEKKVPKSDVNTSQLSNGDKKRVPATHLLSLTKSDKTRKFLPPKQKSKTRESNSTCDNKANETEELSAPPGLCQISSVDISMPPGLELDFSKSSGAIVNVQEPTRSEEQAKIKNGEFEKTNDNASINAYLKVPNYKDRMDKLMKTCTNLLRTTSRKTVFLPGSKIDRVKTFKECQQNFINRNMNAEEYYCKITSLLGDKHMHTLFSDFLLLLPDIDLQHKLLFVHHQNVGVNDMPAKNQKTPWKIEPQVFPGAQRIDNNFMQCLQCHQIISELDYNFHMAQHPQGDLFPSLR